MHTWWFGMAWWEMTGCLYGLTRPATLQSWYGSTRLNISVKDEITDNVEAMWCTHQRSNCMIRNNLKHKCTGQVGALLHFRSTPKLLQSFVSIQPFCTPDLLGFTFQVCQAEAKVTDSFIEWRRISWNLCQTRRQPPHWQAPCHRRLAWRRCCQDSVARRRECTPSWCRPGSRTLPTDTQTNCESMHAHATVVTVVLQAVLVYLMSWQFTGLAGSLHHQLMVYQMNWLFTWWTSGLSDAPVVYLVSW